MLKKILILIGKLLLLPVVLLLLPIYLIARKLGWIQNNTNPVDAVTQQDQTAKSFAPQQANPPLRKENVERNAQSIHDPNKLLIAIQTFLRVSNKEELKTVFQQYPELLDDKIDPVFTGPS